MIKLLIADDQTIFRESLKIFIEQSNEITVIGCAANGQEAFDLCQKLKPEIVLMDVMMPDCDGIEGTKLIKTSCENIKVIILTALRNEESIAKALKHGADGYVLKNVKPDDLILAIKSAARGFKIIHEHVFDSIKKQFNNNCTCSEQDYNIGNLKLTDRDITLIKLISSGYSNMEIAQKLYLSEGSVKNAITGVLKKLNLQNRIELAVFAVKSGIV